MQTAKMIIAATVAAVAFAVPAHAMAEDSSSKITLPAGGKPATYKGSIRGHAAAEYVFEATAGQKVRIDLETDNRSTFFNLLQDGKPNALFVGSSKGDTFSGALPSAGTYRVKIYMMRNVARQNITSKYTLRLR